jgi:hypothetical protein
MLLGNKLLFFYFGYYVNEDNVVNRLTMKNALRCAPLYVRRPLVDKGTYAWSTASLAMHLQFDLSAYALEIRTVQDPTCIDQCAVDCTLKII